MTLKSYDLLTREGGEPLDKQSADLDVLFNSLGIGPSQILVAEAAYKILKIFGKLRVDAGVGSGDVIVKSQLDSGVSTLQSQIDAMTAHLASLDSSLVDVYQKVGTSQSGVDSLSSMVDKLLSGQPLEDSFTATEGQTIFTSSLLTWTNDNSNVDILVFRNGDKMAQAASGGDFHKSSTTQIVFETGLRVNTLVTIRQNIPWSVVVSFLNYVTGVNGLVVPANSIYNQGTNQLAVYRNGLYMANTSSLGVPADRYTENHPYSILLADSTLSSAFFVMWNRLFTPVRTVSSVITGTTIPVPTYTMGNKTLLVFRGGLLLNAAALGDPDLQYTETDTSHISVLLASTADSLWILEVLPSAPTWRQDQSGVVGITLTFSGAYVMGSKRLFLYKNGALMLNTSISTLGDSNNRYVEATVNSVTLETASVATDVWSAIYY